MAVDLIRPALRARRSTLTTARVVLAANVAVTALVVALVVTIGVQWLLETRLLAGYTSQVAALQPQWSALRDQTQQIRTLRRSAGVIQEALAAPPWVDVFEALRAALPPGVWLAKVAVTETGTLEITAQTQQAQGVPQFLQRLAATPGLSNVRLVLTEPVRTGGTEATQATISASVALR